MTQDPIRHYVVVKARGEGVKPEDFNADSEEARRKAATRLALLLFGETIDHPPFQVRAIPSNDVFSGQRRPKRRPKTPDIVVALDVTGSDEQPATNVVDDIIKAVEQKPKVFTGDSPDLPFATADHWCMGDASDSIFADRTAAQRVLGVDYLCKQASTNGQGVNVVIVDQGLDRQALGNRYGDGWHVGNAKPGSPRPDPGSVRRSHGMMIANNILKIAPQATLFDMPLAPTKISNIQAFLSLADAAYRKMLIDISLWRGTKYPGPWIVVNPWGIFDRKSEYPRGCYTENPHNPFNILVAGAVLLGIDVVFAAGNCGQFCPDKRCGGLDRGPSRSIWGANSLDAVLTAGAVRADDMWLGYSSQGPGQPRLGADKPDLCATSQFREDDDAFSINTGTSAACGLTAGIVAALRSRWDSARVSPHHLKQALNQTARKPVGVPWTSELKHRLGHGVLDARAAFDALKNQYP
jgi:hypothetical protein